MKKYNLRNKNKDLSVQISERKQAVVIGTAKKYKNHNQIKKPFKENQQNDDSHSNNLASKWSQSKKYVLAAKSHLSSPKNKMKVSSNVAESASLSLKDWLNSKENETCTTTHKKILLRSSKHSVNNGEAIDKLESSTSQNISNNSAAHPVSKVRESIIVAEPPLLGLKGMLKSNENESCVTSQNKILRRSPRCIIEKTKATKNENVSPLLAASQSKPAAESVLAMSTCDTPPRLLANSTHCGSDTSTPLVKSGSIVLQKPPIEDLFGFENLLPPSSDLSCLQQFSTVSPIQIIAESKTVIPRRSKRTYKSTSSVSPIKSQSISKTTKSNKLKSANESTENKVENLKKPSKDIVLFGETEEQPANIKDETDNNKELDFEDILDENDCFEEKFVSKKKKKASTNQGSSNKAAKQKHSKRKTAVKPCVLPDIPWQEIMDHELVIE